VTEPVPLESILPCLQGVIPAAVATCSGEGVPNVTVISIVHYVDSERVALTRQFFNKTSANLDENPQAQVIVIDPRTADQYRLDLRFLHTETEGPIFDAVGANLDAIASQTGMEGVFRLRGVDIHRVLACEAFGDIVGGRERDPAHAALASLDAFVRRLEVCADYDEATRRGLEALDDLFGYGHAILLAADKPGDRLFAVASNGYGASSAGAEVPVGVGVIGVAAERRAVVCVQSMRRSRGMRAGLAEGVRASGAELTAGEIPLPGFEGADSVAAVPLVVHGALTGVLYLESERPGTFGPADEQLLRIIGGHLATALATLQADRRESAAPRPAPRPDEPGGEPIEVAYYQADDSVLAGGEYVIKGVPGRILWKLLGEYAADGRTSFTNRELRLDERLGLPVGNDNLEARLLVLRKRLAAAGRGIGLERVGRGRLELTVEGPLALTEVPTSGPMRAAHETREAG
jgi:adenylate cyclase